MALPFSPRFEVQPPQHLTFGADAIPALLVAPKTETPCPAALIQHGYGSSKDDVVPLAMSLATYGFVTLLPDAWGHGERFPTAGPSWMTEISADYFALVLRHTATEMREALTMLLARPEVRDDTCLLAGFSMGAMAALVVGTEDARVSGLISVSGSPLPDMVNHTLFGAPMAGEEARQWAFAHDAVANLPRFAPKPLLLQHGTLDDMVPIAGTLRLYEAAKPLYAAYPERLALMLYDHSHLVTPAELDDAVTWMAPFFTSLPPYEALPEQEASA